MQIEKPNTSNYFAFYELPVAFAIDEPVLKQLYLNKSKIYHPDFYSDNIEDQAIAIATSSFNNNAFKTLSNPISRAQYIVDLQADLNEQTVQLPNDFLMEMMDLNEALETEEASIPEALQKQIGSYKQEVFDQIQAHALAQDWVNTQMALLKWRYLERLEQRLR
jgi:molecular chaperone HscB